VVHELQAMAATKYAAPFVGPHGERAAADASMAAKISFAERVDEEVRRDSHRPPSVCHSTSVLLGC
jgi:hypothetical protein